MHTIVSVRGKPSARRSVLFVVSQSKGARVRSTYSARHTHKHTSTHSKHRTTQTTSCCYQAHTIVRNLSTINCDCLLNKKLSTIVYTRVSSARVQTLDIHVSAETIRAGNIRLQLYTILVSVVSTRHNQHSIIRIELKTPYIINWSNYNNGE